MEKYMLPCLTKKYLGFDCMGCGLQRSFVFVVKGDFANAFQMYPAIFPLLLLCGFVGITMLLKVRYSYIITTFLAISTALVMIISYIIKLTYLTII